MTDMFKIDELVGAFAVFAASKEAAFLHGRYVHSNFDDAPWLTIDLEDSCGAHGMLRSWQLAL